MKIHHLLLLLWLPLIPACGGNRHARPHLTDNHLQLKEPSLYSDIPQANRRVIPLPPPKPSSKVDTYSLIVTNVPAPEILFALARDAKINLDINPGIQGNVTLNAIKQRCRRY